MRKREVERIRRHVKHSLDNQSLRSLARRIGISHHALRCFLDSQKSKRTQERTLERIREAVRNWYWPSQEQCLSVVKHWLSRLQPPLTAKDAEDLMASIRERVDQRAKGTTSSS